MLFNIDLLSCERAVWISQLTNYLRVRAFDYFKLSLFLLINKIKPLFYLIFRGSRRKISVPLYVEDEGNDLSDLGIGTSSTSGKSSLSEDFDNHSVIVSIPKNFIRVNTR